MFRTFDLTNIAISVRIAAVLLVAAPTVAACGSDASTGPGLSDATSSSDAGPTLCNSASQCPAPANPCEVAVCVAGVCARAAAPDGTFVPEANQIPGDCKEFTCGEGGTLVTRAAPDDLPPDDGNPCTAAVCDGPNPVHEDVEAGTPCDEAGVCNAAGDCGDCRSGDADCDGDIPRVCDEDGAWVSQAPCPFVCEGDGICGGVCRPGARSCNGRQPRVCGETGQWENDGVLCEFACSEGACAGNCLPGALQCSGNLPEACSESGAWVASEPCPFACQAGECIGLCAPGAKRCQGLSAQSCGATGQWTTTNDCPFLCADGDCTGTCTPGAKRCVGRTSQECDGTGQWVDSQTCDFACVAGNCAGICQPATTRCSNNLSQICDSQGQWQTSETCTHACLGTGTCGGVCTPGATRCAGNSAETCDASGAWTSTPCEFTCASGACTGICTPGAARCSGNLSQTCNQNGQWTTDTTCPFACSGAGTCSGECSPSALRCSGATPQQCDASGTWTSLDTCTYACQNGACTGVCSPGSTRCVANTAQSCDITGQWQTTQACPYVCTAGACTGVCTPGDARCLENTPQTCDESGLWESLPPCSGTSRCSEGSCSQLPTSCAAILETSPSAANGLYDVDPDGAGPILPTTLYCDIKNGGWTLVANIYDSIGDDAPNSTDYVVSGWQQIGSGEWAAPATKVDLDARGSGSAAVSLAFVAALHASAGQPHLKMCFVNAVGEDTVCRSSTDGSLELVAYPTGNAKLTAFSNNMLAYTFGRLAGLAGSVDGYDASRYQNGGFGVPRLLGDAYEFGFGDATAPYNNAMSEIPSIHGYFGVWHGSGTGKSYRPWFVDGRELTFLATQDDPPGSPRGFRLYVGP